MSFRKIQDYVSAPSTVVIEPESTTNEVGEVLTAYVDQDKEMPDPAMFDLKNIVDAGVRPEEVDSRIIRGSVLDGDAVVRKYVKHQAAAEKAAAEKAAEKAAAEKAAEKSADEN